MSSETTWSITWAYDFAVVIHSSYSSAMRHFSSTCSDLLDENYDIIYSFCTWCDKTARSDT